MSGLAERFKVLLGWQSYCPDDALASPFLKREKRTVAMPKEARLKDVGMTGLKGYEETKVIDGNEVIELTVINTPKEMKNLAKDGFPIDGITPEEEVEAAKRNVSLTNLALVKPLMGMGNTPAQIHIALRKSISITTINHACAAIRAAAGVKNKSGRKT
jgi:hypothetical protein